MFVELHLIQSFAPSNLNRDDTGAPKDCEFGGVRRARISSQCIKRAIREHFKGIAGDAKLFSRNELAVRTRLIIHEVANALAQSKEVGREQAEQVVKAALGAAGIRTKGGGSREDSKTEYLLYLPKSEVAELASVCADNWESLSSISVDVSGQDTSKQRKKKAKEAVPREVSKEVLRIITEGKKAIDISLFGRMLADFPRGNVDAACQVAHAISTHKVSMELDFYTAVDDLNPKEETGAGMMGSVEFNSACYYRYANVHLEQLKKNLDGDERVARSTVEAFLKASVAAVPSGKQNCFAAHNPPSFILVVLRDGVTPLSLANAFEKPVRPDREGGFVGNSIEALDDYWTRLTAVYGSDGVEYASTILRDCPELTNFYSVSFDQLIEFALQRLAFETRRRA